MAEAELINRRFHQKTYDKLQWPSSGDLIAHGVLVHIADGYEERGQLWSPCAETIGLSGSLICQQQKRVPEVPPTTYRYFLASLG